MQIANMSSLILAVKTYLSPLFHPSNINRELVMLPSSFHAHILAVNLDSRVRVLAKVAYLSMGYTLQITTTIKNAKHKASDRKHGDLNPHVMYVNLVIQYNFSPAFFDQCLASVFLPEWTLQGLCYLSASHFCGAMGAVRGNTAPHGGWFVNWNFSS